MKVKTFMLGWEFPPFISGGLGTACYGLTKAMSKLGLEITFVLPRAGEACQDSPVKMLSAEGHLQTKEFSEFKNIRFQTISSPLKPYDSCGTSRGCQSGKQTGSTTTWQFSSSEQTANYGRNIHEEVNLYAQKVAEIASIEDFDIIHAHDWMTYPAGIAAAQLSKKPLVVHVHSTEFDRSGENVNQTVYDIERRGMHLADKIIAVSNYTKNIISSRYGVPAEKVEVVHNGVEYNGRRSSAYVKR